MTYMLMYVCIPRRGESCDWQCQLGSAFWRGYRFERGRARGGVWEREKKKEEEEEKWQPKEHRWQEEKQTGGKISRTSESDHIGEASAPVCWQGNQSAEDCVWEPSPNQYPCSSGCPPHAPPRPPQYLHQLNTGEWRGVFLVWNIWSSQVSLTQHLSFGVIKACKSGWYESGPWRGLRIGFSEVVTQKQQWCDIKDCKHWRQRMGQLDRSWILNKRGIYEAFCCCVGCSFPDWHK